MDRLPLLATKLHVPFPHPGLVPRPELLAKLEAGLRGAEGSFVRRLTLVSAPAGFGKTTLLAEWARTVGERVAWLSLDEADDDAVRFLTYVLAALRQQAPGIGEGAEVLLGAARSFRGEHVLISLINEIAASPAGKAHHLVLVLDDYHLITNGAIHALVSFLLEHMPAQLHLVLATRADPPLALSRLRARRQLLEIRQADLQFTPEEATAFLNELAGLGLSNAEVALLHERSEGWVTGLQMAALALRSGPGQAGSDDRAARVKAFGGSQRYILDYLLEEVLQREPEGIQRFLLHTSVLPQLCAPLCAAVLPEEQPPGAAQAVLDHLETANLFIVPLDDERRWYRYHHLFAELLQRRLRQTLHGEAVGVYRRASVWYEEEGLVEMAIEQALAAGDYERAASLIAGAAEEMLMRSEIDKLLRLLGTLPETVLHDRPKLRAFRGGALLLRGAPLEQVRPFLSGPEDNAAGDGELLAFRALLTMMQGQVLESEALSRQAQDALPPASHFLRTLVVENLGFVRVLRGEYAGAAEAFGEAVRLGREHGNLLVAVGALCNLAGLHTTEGHLRQAETVYKEALELARDRQGELLPIAGKALFGLGDLYFEWNRLGEAGAYLAGAVELMARYGEIGLGFAYTSLARVRLAEGDATAAESLLGQAEQQAARTDSSTMDDLLVSISRIYSWLLQGQVDKASRHATIALEKLPVEAPQFREAADGMVARLRLAEGRPEAARALLEPLCTQIGKRGHRGSALKLSVPLALALEAQGDLKGALSHLAGALEWAAREGYTRAFLNEGAMPYGRRSLPRLLYTAVEQGVQPEYAGRLLALLAEQPLTAVPSSSEAAGGEALVEPLSERERQVLQLIAAGLSNQAIAERLVIAESTVKGHTSNIYAKLGVSKRTAAVARAQMLGLLT